MRSGVIIAGGRSTRFGDADKALADLGGTLMIRRVADRLTDVIDELVVNCRPAQTPAVREAMAGYPHDIAFGEDKTPDRGPVAGIRNGLGAAGGEYAVVVACDMPFVDPELVTHLFERAAGADGAVPRVEDGWYQTTQAVYRVAAMYEACAAVLERTENPRILAPLDELEFTVVDRQEVTDVASVDSFENVNTRAEFKVARKRLDTA